MTRRRTPETTLPAVLTPTQTVGPADPLTDSSAATWARWSRDREQRRIETLMHAEAENRALMTQPLYPLECAKRIAEDMRGVAKDWRAMRPTLGPAWGRLLKAQPELGPELTRQRRMVLDAIITSLPAHLQTTANELHNLIDLLLTGHEAAAYHVGFCAGQLDAELRDRVETQRARRRQVPALSAPALRLHLDGGL
jgi:hypothetical protein